MKDWYVNLAARRGAAQGPTIPLKVSRSIASILTSKTVNRRVTWDLAPDGENLNTVAADAVFLRGTGANTQQSITAETDKKFVNELRLPPYGGDTYRVTASKTRNGAVVLNEEYRAVRRLYYTVHFTNDEGKRLYDAVKPELLRIFREVFIELEEVGKSRIAERPVTYDLRPLVANAPRLTKKPQHMRLALVNMFATEEPYTVTLRVEPAAPVGGDTVAYGGGRWTFLVNLPPEDALEAHARRYFANDVTATCKVSDYWNHRDILTMPDNRLACRATYRSARQVLVTLTDPVHNQVLFAHSAAGAAQAPKRQFSVDIEVNALRNLGGQSERANIGLTQDMSMYYPDDRAARPRALARVFAHEIAHAIGLVKRRGTHNGGVDHSNWYDDANGGRGPHCHSNANLVDNTADAAGIYFTPQDGVHRVYRPGGAGICIMYHKRTAYLHDMQFCDECKEQLRAADLSAGALGGNRWNDAY